MYARCPLGGGYRPHPLVLLQELSRRGNIEAIGPTGCVEVREVLAEDQRKVEHERPDADVERIEKHDFARGAGEGVGDAHVGVYQPHGNVERQREVAQQSQHVRDLARDVAVGVELTQRPVSLGQSSRRCGRRTFREFRRLKGVQLRRGAS